MVVFYLLKFSIMKKGYIVKCSGRKKSRMEKYSINRYYIGERVFVFFASYKCYEI